jgi:hypothetical protein
MICPIEQVLAALFAEGKISVDPASMKDDRHDRSLGAMAFSCVT